MVKVFPYSKELLIKERIRSLSGSKFFPLRQLKRRSYLERGTIEENRCLIKKSPFGVRNFMRNAIDYYSRNQ